MTDKKNSNNRGGHGSDFKLVHKAWGPSEAEVIKSFLQSHGISCILKGLVVQSVHPFSMDGLGEIKIFVPEKDYAHAKNLLKSRESE
jgi:hypothetical protein